MQEFKFKPKSDEWLKKRSNYVTATEVASLIGLDPYKSSNKLLQDKINPTRLPDNPAMKKGRLLEPSVFIALQEIGIDARPADYENVVMLTDDDNQLAATLDGRLKTDKADYVVECKTTKGELFPKWRINPPLKYLLQVQTQLHVAQLDSAVLACLNSDNILELIVYRVEKLPEVQSIIAQESRRFWNCYKSEESFKVNKDFKKSVEIQIFNKLKLVFDTKQA